MFAAAGEGGPVEEFVGWGGGGGGFWAFGGGGGCHGAVAAARDGVVGGRSREEGFGDGWEEWSVVWAKEHGWLG